MAQFSVAGWYDADPEGLLPLTDDLVVSSDGGTLFAASRSGGGLVSFSLSPGGELDAARSDARPMPETYAALGGLNLELVEIAGEALLVPLAVGPDGLSYFGTGGPGALSNSLQPLGTGDLEVRPTAIETVTFGGVEHVYLTVGGPGEIRHYSAGNAAPVTEASLRVYDVSGVGANLIALEQVNLGSVTYLITASQSDDSVSTFRLAEDGRPLRADSFGAVDGLGIDIPTALEIATVGMSSFAVLASAGSDSLSVLEISPNGGLTPTDHVLDTRETRFESVVALDVVEQDGRALVLAGGSDDGVSLFELLPSGMLIHLGSFEDQLTTGLQNVEDIAALWQDERLHIFVGSAREPGVTHLTVELGPLGEVVTASGSVTGSPGRDILEGSGANDVLNGFGGDDILIAGIGSDTLSGGPGDDVFLIAGDNAQDVILDFEPGRDRIVIDQWEGVMGAGDLSFSSRSTGGVIRAGETVLVVETADGARLEEEDLALAVAGGVTDTPTGPVTDEIIGTPLDDDLNGTPGDDVFVGLDGADRLVGGAGTDAASYADSRGSLLADLLFSGINTNVAQGDTYVSIENLYGSPGFDNLRGTFGDNYIFGDRNVDYIFGRRGDDMLEGGIGDDVLFGGVGADTLIGGPDRDRAQYSEAISAVTVDLADPELNSGEAAGDSFDSIEDLAGGKFGDTLFGDWGANRLFGREGADVLIGREGDDYLNGGANGDRLEGGSGNDTLRGGTHGDTFVFDRGHDIVEDFRPNLGDRLAIDDDWLWTGTRSASWVTSRARVDGDDVVIRFSETNSLRLQDYSDVATLDDYIVIF